MSVKGSLRKVASGVNLTHPKLNMWYILGLIIAVAVLYAGLEGGKYLYNWTKTKVGAHVPGVPTAQTDLRATLGI